VARDDPMDPLFSIPRCQLLFSLLRTTQVRMIGRVPSLAREEGIYPKMV
jgi:hypothetical protein